MKVYPPSQTLYFHSLALSLVQVNFADDAVSLLASLGLVNFLTQLCSSPLAQHAVSGSPAFSGHSKARWLTQARRARGPDSCCSAHTQLRFKPGPEVSLSPLAQFFFKFHTA